MKKLLAKLHTLAIMAGTTAMLLPMTAFAAADEVNFDDVTNPIVNLLNSLLGPAIAIVGALGAVYCVILGVKFAKAEEPQEREKAKAHLKNAIIGFLLIFILMVALKGAIGPLQRWATGR